MDGKSRRVFVVHGRNVQARDAMFEFLRSIDLQPIEWSQAIEMTSKASPYIGEVLDAALAAAQAIVVLMTPDEITYLRTEYSSGDHDTETQPAAQARPNVLFEAGMAMGGAPDRTVLVEFGRLRPFSDMAGRHALRLRDTADSRKELAQRLKTAGCTVDTSGAGWLKAGDFATPPEPGDGLPLGKKVPSQPRKQVGFDVQFHDRSSGGGRLQVVNRGTEDAFEVNVIVPGEVQGFQIHNDELPLRRLPAGKSFSLQVMRFMGGGEGPRDYFDVTITAKLADGTPVNEDVFVSLVS
jgi:hypothetical protein